MTPTLIRDSGMTAAAKMVYTAIRHAANESGNSYCDRSIRTLARDTGLRTSTITAAKRELKALGWIEIREKSCGRGFPAHVITVVPVADLNHIFYEWEDRPERTPGTVWGTTNHGRELIEFEVKHHSKLKTYHPVRVLLSPV